MLVPSTRYLLAHIARHRLAFAGMALLGALASFAEAFGLVLIVPLTATVLGIDELAGGPGAMEAIGAAAASIREALGLAGLAAVVMLLIGAKAGLHYAVGWAGAALKAQVAHEVRMKAVAGVLFADYRTVAGRSPGELQNVVAGETWRVTDAVGALLGLVSELTVIAIFAALLLAISWELTLLAAVAGLIGLFLSSRISRRAYALGGVGVEANNRMSERIAAVLGGLRTVKAFAQEARELRTLEALSQDVRRAFRRLERVSRSSGAVLEAVYLPFVIGALLLTGAAGIGPAALVAFLLLLLRLLPHVRALEALTAQLKSLLGAVESVRALADLAPERAAAHGHAPAPAGFAEIRFDGVAYETDSFTLSPVDLRIAKGEIVALVGPSGCGKSTLVNMLLGFVRPSAGRILVDGADLAGFDPVSWRRRLGFAGQAADLFAGPLGENIAYGDPDRPPSAVAGAAEAAGAGFVARLPRGFATQIGRGGAGLSGGEAQRIALARALLVRPALLLLDEATNAVDLATEKQLLATVESLRGRTTCLLITHRLESARIADRIVVMERGRVVEEGTPAELFRSGTRFEQLSGPVAP